MGGRGDKATPGVGCVIVLLSALAFWSAVGAAVRAFWPL